MLEQMPLPPDDNPWSFENADWLKDPWCLRDPNNKPEEWAGMTDDEVREELLSMAFSGQIHEVSSLVVGPVETPDGPTLQPSNNKKG